MSPLVNHRAAMPILLDNHHGDRDKEHQACRECNLRPLRSQLTSSDSFRWVSARSSVSSPGSNGWTISPLAPGHFVVRHLVIIYQTTFCQSAPYRRISEAHSGRQCVRWLLSGAALCPKHRQGTESVLPTPTRRAPKRDRWVAMENPFDRLSCRGLVRSFG